MRTYSGDCRVVDNPDGMPESAYCISPGLFLDGSNASDGKSCLAQPNVEQGTPGAQVISIRTSSMT